MTAQPTNPFGRQVVLWLAAILMMGAATSVAAHKYFFAITDINHNRSANSFEIIHQLTAHDIENTIAEQRNIHFSPELAEYEAFIQEYVENNFHLFINETQIKTNWIGLEVVRDKIIVYQEAAANGFIAPLVVENQLLVDTYPKQINTVNFTSNKIKLSLTFNNSKRIATIDNNH